MRLLEDPLGDRSLASRLIRLSAASLFVYAVFALLDGHSFATTLRYQLLRVDVDFSFKATAAYAVSWLLVWAGLVVALLHERRVVRYATYLVCVSTATAFWALKLSNGYGLSSHEARMAISEVEFFDDALLEFAGVWLPLLGVCALLAGAFELTTGRWVPRVRLWLALALPVAAWPAAYIVVDRSEGKVYQYPAPYGVSVLCSYTWFHGPLYYGERESPWISPSGPPLVDHLVLIMDESVRGDLLGINGGPAETTPYLTSISEQLVNYGVASSPANMSAPSNILVQSGLRPDQLPDRELRSLKNPNLFSYMQRAGFKAFLIDTQKYSRTPHNMLTYFDIEALDGYVQVRNRALGRPEFEMDLAALDDLDEILSGHERSFTYLLKTGAHFPYASKYPDSARRFEPDERSGVPVTTEVKLNTYLNAVHWQLDEFMRALRERFAGRNVLVLYTSDHGQVVEVLGEGRGSRVRFPQGTVIDAPSEEASVPLFFLGLSEHAQAVAADRFLPELVDGASGWELFPTLLELAGYSYDDIRRHYYVSLFHPSERVDRFFVSGNWFEQLHGLPHLSGDQRIWSANTFERPGEHQAAPQE